MERIPDGEGADEAESLLQSRFFEAEKKAQECTRWAGYSEPNPSVQMLDILQESTTLLRKHHPVLTVLALTFSVPLSIILLSHVLLRLPFMEWLVRAVQSAVEEKIVHHIHRIGYRRVAEIILSNMVDIPFSALFSPLLRAGVAYIVASTYEGKRPVFSALVAMLHKVWLLLLQTFAWSCLVYLGLAAGLSALLWFALSVGKSSDMILLSGLVAAAFIGATVAIGFAYANVMCNLAYVVSVSEGLHGREALLRSVHLLQGRLQVTLLMFLVTNVNGTLLDILFEFHIIANSDITVFYDKFWEAPLLVIMHSFVYLFDAIMVSVLYYICKSSDHSHTYALEDEQVHLHQQM